MDAMQGIDSTAALAQGAIKDTTGAQLISKTLDKVNMGAPSVEAGVQFQKDVLGAAGIGTMLDKTV